MQIDLHVHSAFSNRPGKQILRSLGTAESYTLPQKVYDLCRLRNMDMVTITDHDTIDGAMEIAHLPGTFISEEITAKFPEDNVLVHVVALDITDSQHDEIQRLKENIYDLVSYLRNALIPHYLAHPLFSPCGMLSKSHLQKLLLMFEHLEGQNGTLDQSVCIALKQIVHKLNINLIDQWANRYDIDPVNWRETRYFTGGSDDHGGLSIANAFTHFHTADTTSKGLRRAFFSGEMSPSGGYGNGVMFSHGIYATTIKYFQQSKANSAFNALLDDSPISSKRVKQMSSVIDRTIQDAASNTVGGFLEMVTNGHTAKAQERLGKIGRAAIRDTYATFINDLSDAVSSMDIEKGIEAIPGIFSVTSMILPYVFGYRHAVTSRKNALSVLKEMGAANKDSDGCKVAIFSDTGGDINGVSLGLCRLVDAMRAIGEDVHMVTCSKHADMDEPGFETLPSIRDVRIPWYSNITMGIPSIVDVMDFIDKKKISVVQVSTPGPLGLTALFAAKLLGLKVVANYHTELVQYFNALAGYRDFETIVESAVAWFYRQADRTVVPSSAVIPTLVDFGVCESTIEVVQRGVNSDRFNPRKRETGVWKRFGIHTHAPKIIYVGRVSKEKSVHWLISAFNTMRQNGVDAELVIVGDGPHLSSLEAENQQTDIHFLGSRTGEELSTLFASADLFVFPSDTDTFGNVVIEAQASGLPAVVVDKGGPREQVTSGTNGLVVPPKDTEMMAFAMAKLCLDKELRVLYGQAARARAEQLTMVASAKAHRRFYHDVWSSHFRGVATPNWNATRLRPVEDVFSDKIDDDDLMLNIG